MDQILPNFDPLAPRVDKHGHFTYFCYLSKQSPWLSNYVCTHLEKIVIKPVCNDDQTWQIQFLFFKTKTSTNFLLFGWNWTKAIDLDQCPDHVISTGRHIRNLVSNFEFLLVLCFLHEVKFWNLGHLQAKGYLRAP